MTNFFVTWVFLFCFYSNAILATADTDKDIIYYKDLRLFNYRRVASNQYIYINVPENTLSFTWNLVLNKSSSECPEPKISLLAQYGSFPTSISHDDSLYPSDYVLHRTQRFNSSFSERPLIVNNPLYGQWFLGSVMPKNNNQIIKNLLANKCKYGIFGNITFKRADVESITTNHAITLVLNKTENYYRFLVSKATYKFTVTLSNCQLHHPSLNITFNPGSPPTTTTTHSPIIVTCDQTSDQDIEILASEIEKWQYILMTYTQESSSAPPPSLDITITNHECVTGVLRNHTGFIPCYLGTNLKTTLFPDDVHMSYFTFNEDSPDSILIPRKHVSMTTLMVDAFSDVGGFFLMEFEINPISSGFSQDVNNFEVRVCIQRGSPPISANLNLACDNDESLLVFNSSRMTSKLKVMFPEPGLYFIAYQDSSRNRINPTNSSALETVNKTTTNTTTDEDRNVSFGVSFKADVTMCEHTVCEHNGRCNQVFKGAFLLAACKCIAQTKGLTCADTSDMVPYSEQLFYTLMLTLSNLAFVPAIIVSFYRWRYTECLIYTLNMFFSTFYHACDMNAWSVYGFCIFRYRTLQYADFLTSVLSFWFTLMAMSRIRSGYLLVFSTFGMVVAAILMENDSTGAWNTGVPIGCGLLLVIVTWGIKGYKTKRIYPSRKDYYWIIPGFCLAVLGIVVFAAVENDINYPFTHSFWHISVAFSVPFMLPRHRSVWKLSIVDEFMRIYDKNSSDEVGENRQNTLEGV